MMVSYILQNVLVGESLNDPFYEAESFISKVQDERKLDN